MKRLCLSLALAVVATLLVVVPVLAAYFAYIYIEESDGNAYESLPIIASTNITQLVETHFISSTGLDTRVLTGSGEPLPHMLADDKLLFVTDLAAYEDKTLLFYLGATSLSSFPTIVGYGGNVTTADDPDLEWHYVWELLADGYFECSNGTNKNILWKDDAFRMWISADDTLRVATLNSTGDEQWHLQYSSFTTGEHTVYVVANGLGAALYVDDFVTAKDTENLYTAGSLQLDNVYDTYISDTRPQTFYASGRFWAFWRDSATDDYFHFRTSTDGDTWAAEQTFACDLASDVIHGFGVWFDGTYMHIAYGDYENNEGPADLLEYRMGTPEASGNITWVADWQDITVPYNSQYISWTTIATDQNSYPYILFTNNVVTADHAKVMKSATNNGTWTTASGYPVDLYTYDGIAITGYPNSNKMYALVRLEADDDTLVGRYYNGSAWSTEGIATSVSHITLYASCVADENDNVYIVWEQNMGTHQSVHFKIRYSDGSMSSIVDIAGSEGNNARFPGVTYDSDTGTVYVLYNLDGTCKVVALTDAGWSAEYTVCGLPGGDTQFTNTRYGSHIGVLTSTSGSVTHGYVQFPWGWNDNANDWYWMQNNVMPYADDFQMAVYGDLVLEYKPASIIQGTTLPDEESDHDGTISWGTNPAGVNVTISGLQTDNAYNQTYYYQFMNPDSRDIIKPEPGSLTTDVDTAGLVNNPLYPLVHALGSQTGLTDRLVWLLFGWLIVIGAMLFVHIGFDTKRDTEKPQHFVLTTITGLGLSILFYTMGIFPLWVVILMAFGLVGAIIWERQPVL